MATSAQMRLMTSAFWEKRLVFRQKRSVLLDIGVSFLTEDVLSSHHEQHESVELPENRRVCSLKEKTKIDLFEFI